jgi:amidohydrolase
MRLFTRLSAGFLFLAAVILTTGSARAQRKQAGPRKSTSSSGLNPEEMQIIRKMVAMDSARLSALFIDLHQNPELGFMEVRTSGIVAKELNALGYDVKTNIGKTGVVGILKNGAGPIVMYRGDMDCNAVEETTGLPYASKKRVVNLNGLDVPVMHACGHDAHTTWVMGIAKVMAASKNYWKGTLVMVAQPSEEPGGGADAMAAEMYTMGVPVPQFLFGMHTAPVPVGYYVNAAGDRMAGADQLDVTFHGVGGHGSTPQEARDPIVMAANAILQYQTIISRNLDPQRPAVLTVGAVNAGIDNNVIPASATLKLNLRWFSKEDRTLMIDGIRRINEGIAVANALPKDRYPVIDSGKQFIVPLKNNEAMVQRLDPLLELYNGKGKNLPVPPAMGSEDFHHLVLQHPQVQYVYLLVGTANKADFTKAASQGKKFPYMNHNGDYKVDLSALSYYTIMGALVLLDLFRQ